MSLHKHLSGASTKMEAPKTLEIADSLADEEDEVTSYDIYSSVSQPVDYYGLVGYDETDNLYELYNSHTNGEADEYDPFTAQMLERLKDVSEESARQSEDGEKSLYDIQSTSTGSLDLENNGLLWLPPEAEDEDDSSHEDEESRTGEWGDSDSPNSIQSNQENSGGMKDVVSGHFRSLILQLLKVENLPIEEEDGWLEIIVSLSWEVAALLKPDTSEDGGMDPARYVKVKCLACGRRNDSMVVKGIVCKKNVAHRRMMSKIDKPQVLILGGALEYQRVSSHLSSVDTLLRQETEHLKMVVAKIDAHKPNVLLVEKTVSRYAQEYLLAKNISLVLNIKKQLLERIGRCSGAQIIPSVNHLVSPKLGYCDLFYVEKCFEEHGSVGQGGKKLTKNLMFFRDCPKPLGFTILLKGAHGDELKKVKHVVQYGVFAAYHLALETSFLADEGASLPNLPIKPPDIPFSDKPSQTATKAVPYSSIPSKEASQNNCSSEYDETSPLSMKSCLTSPAQCRKHDHSDVAFESPMQQFSDSEQNDHSPNCASEHDCERDGTPTPNYLYTPKHVEEHVFYNKHSGDESNHASTISQSTSIEEIDSIRNEGAQLLREGILQSPSEDHSILVSKTTRCVWKGAVCEKAHFLRIKYYGSADKPLGKFLQDVLFDQNYRCGSCEQPSEAHIYCYSHHQGSLTIFVTKLDELILPGEKEGKIWMWHRCLRCPRVNGFPPSTQRIAMSDAAWGFSFGKFLELSFSHQTASCRVSSCGHSIHRDCLRFYGSGRMVACFRYAPIDVYSVHLPPPQIEFNYGKHEWILKEVIEVKNKGNLFFNEVKKALKQILDEVQAGSYDSSVKVQELKEHCNELEKTLSREKEEYEESLKRVVNKEEKNGDPGIDVLELNRLRRQVLFQSYVWDQRLVHSVNLHKSVCKEALSPKRKAMPHLNSSNTPKKTDGNSEGGANSPVKKKPIESLKKANTHESGCGIQRSVSDSLAARLLGESPPSSKANDSPFLADGNSVVARFDDEDKCNNKIGEEEKVGSPSKSFLWKTSSNVENSTSWLAMPFLNFYRSPLNKSPSWNRHKLDNVKGYNPVYIMSFRELECQDGARLLLPVGVNDTIVAVYDDEPSSIIAYSLLSPEYYTQISSDETDHIKRVFGFSDSLQHLDLEMPLDSSVEPWRNFVSANESMISISRLRSNLDLEQLSYVKPLHTRVSFSDDGPPGKVKYTVVSYFSRRFEVLRKMCCPNEMDFVRSLSRCMKWGAEGGKSNVFFAKTPDDRFILKQVTKTELESFIKFAPAYFKYLSESISNNIPTCLAKILGVYQVSKQAKGGKETKMDILVMENLLYQRDISVLYDLKGSRRSRYSNDSSKVLLDQNLLESMATSPIFVSNSAKRVLERAIWNDTSFLASVDVMDYSLLVGVDKETHELVVGIIDIMRQYTWDKHLETWVKASGILGGPKDASPTVISPMQYKKRFRKAMSTYFIMVPDCWSPNPTAPNGSIFDICED